MCEQENVYNSIQLGNDTEKYKKLVQTRACTQLYRNECFTRVTHLMTMTMFALVRSITSFTLKFLRKAITAKPKIFHLCRLCRQKNYIFLVSLREKIIQTL